MDVYWCKTCLNMSTRPQIEFNHDGICNACTWREEKEKLNWQSRQDELEGYFKVGKRIRISRRF